MIRAYTPADKPALIEIFNSNVPKYFAPEEQDDLHACVAETGVSYFVLEKKGKVVGSGGIVVNEDDTVSICWGMIHNSYHKTGLGKQLLEFRLQKLKELYPGKDVIVNTSQATELFFTKYGFKTIYTENDYWSKGLHLYQMLRPADVS
ncbi:MAG: GNAT family N-acetyltransferase [Bacteroidia bacterium]